MIARNLFTMLLHARYQAELSAVPTDDPAMRIQRRNIWERYVECLGRENDFAKALTRRTDAEFRRQQEEELEVIVQRAREDAVKRGLDPDIAEATRRRKTHRPVLSFKIKREIREKLQLPMMLAFLDTMFNFGAMEFPGGISEDDVWWEARPEDPNDEFEDDDEAEEEIQ